MRTATAGARVRSFLSLPTPPCRKLHSSLDRQLVCIKKLQGLSTCHLRTCSVKFIPSLLFASTSSSSIVEEEEDEEEGDESVASPSDDELLLQLKTSALDQPSQNLSSVSGCQACGKDEIEKGCNGEGRIQGGIATVPGFGWWPIKAYRPCPAYLATGGRYKRRGQSMDEVASGGMNRAPAKGKTSKKKEGPRR